MRKVIFGGANSLDNFFARKDDSVDWLMWSDEVMPPIALRQSHIQSGRADATHDASSIRIFKIFLRKWPGRRDCRGRFSTSAIKIDGRRITLSLQSR